MATTTRVSCGAPGRSRLMSILTSGRRAALLPGPPWAENRPHGRRVPAVLEHRWVSTTALYYRKRASRRNDRAREAIPPVPAVLAGRPEGLAPLAPMNAGLNP